jgi:CUE domain
MTLVPFLPPDNNSNDRSSLDSINHNQKSISRILEKNVYSDPSIHEYVRSYLRYRSRIYEPASNQLLELDDVSFQLVLKCFKLESAWIDVGIIIDFIALFGPSNPLEVTKSVSDLLSSSSKLSIGANASMRSVSTILKSRIPILLTTLVIDYMQGKEENLSNIHSKLDDLLHFLADILFTMQHVIALIPSISYSFHPSGDVLTSEGMFKGENNVFLIFLSTYEVTIPYLTSFLSYFFSENKQFLTSSNQFVPLSTLQLLQTASSSCLQCLHAMFEQVYFIPMGIPFQVVSVIMENARSKVVTGARGDSSTVASAFISIIAKLCNYRSPDHFSALSWPNNIHVKRISGIFLLDFVTNFNILDRVERLSSTLLDPRQVVFLNSTISDALSITRRELKKNDETSSSVDDYESKILNVKDILPHVSDAHILHLLKESSGDVNVVIEKLLSNEPMTFSPMHGSNTGRNDEEVRAKTLRLAQQQAASDAAAVQSAIRQQREQMQKKTQDRHEDESVRRNSSRLLELVDSANYAYDENAELEVEDDYDDTFDGLEHMDAPPGGSNDDMESFRLGTSLMESLDLDADPQIQAFATRRAGPVFHQVGKESKGPLTARQSQRKETLKARIGNHNRKTAASRKITKASGPI